MTQKQKDTPLTAEFKHQGIPIIDEENPEETMKALTSVFAGCDAIAKARTEKAIKTTKIILCKQVPDWINPYAKEGGKIAVILFSTHPDTDFQTGARFDRGFQMAAKKQGYEILFTR